jgi:hypothetical protein
MQPAEPLPCQNDQVSAPRPTRAAAHDTNNQTTGGGVVLQPGEVCS